MSEQTSRWINTIITPTTDDLLLRLRESQMLSENHDATEKNIILDPSLSFLFVPVSSDLKSRIENTANFLLRGEIALHVSSIDLDFYSTPSTSFESFDHLSTIWGYHTYQYYRKFDKIPRGASAFPDHILQVQLSSLADIWDNDSIVIERSPPSLETLAALFKEAPGVAIGAYIGVQSGISNPPLMLLTVPTGIIVCGAAFGVATALRDGLRDRITRWASPSVPDNKLLPGAAPTSSAVDKTNEAADDELSNDSGELA